MFDQKTMRLVVSHQHIHSLMTDGFAIKMQYRNTVFITLNRNVNMNKMLTETLLYRKKETPRPTRRCLEDQLC